MRVPIFFKMRSLAAAAIVLAALFIWQAPASAQTRIVAIVNGTPITSTAVAEQKAFVRLTQKKQMTDKDALAVLVDQTLVQQEAKRRTVTVSDSDVDQRFNGLAAGNKMTPDQLGQGLAQAGTSARTFKENIRAQLIQRRLVNFRIRASSGVAEKDIAAQITERKQKGDAANDVYTLQQILFVTPANPPPAVVAQRKKEAETLRTRIQSCDQGAEFAKSLRDVAVKEKITRQSSQMSDAFRQKVQALKIGQATPPDLSSVGVEIVMICSKQSVQDDTALRQEITNELAGEASKGETDKMMAELRQKALIEYR